MNKVILIGRLTDKPELAYTPNQIAVTKFSIAVDRQSKEGGADFIRITVFGRQAESVCRYMDKGRQIAVLGRIQTGSYKNREGKTVYTQDVIADYAEFLGNAPAKEETAKQIEQDANELFGFPQVSDGMPF